MAYVLREIFSPRNRTRTIEIIALLPATVLLGPFLLYGMFGMLLALAGTAMSSQSFQAKVAIAEVMLWLLVCMLVGAAGMACLWILIALGRDSICRRPLLRRLAIALLLLGVADGVYFLLSDRSVTKAMVSTGSSIALWAAVLAIPMLLGIRHIYLLIRPSPQSR